MRLIAATFGFEPMQHIAVEAGCDLLFFGAEENCVLLLLVCDFGDVAEVDFVVGQGDEGFQLVEPRVRFSDKE